MKKLSLVFSMVCMAVVFAVAQRTVVGTVLDDGGEALIGASVLAKGTSAGTVTDVNGKFSLAVPREASTLVVSYTGYTTQEIALGASNVVEVRLAGSTVLNEVVVTALGIRRDKKALGYASTTVSSAEIAEKPETDVARALTGRSPGLTITNSSGIAGSGTKINIRGTSTVSGNSQPLWVVDGVPINTESNENNNFADGNITPTRNIDIDPNNIESISILRGLSATTLYGSQGRNGVILVSTKTGTPGKKKFTASLSQSYHQVQAHVPEFQNKWANGFDGDYGEFFSNWGSLFNGKAPTNPAGGVATPYWRHPYFEHRALFPEFPEFTTIDGKSEATGYIPVAQPNNVKDFFQTGTSATTSFNAGVSNDLGSFNISFAHTNESGYIKNNDLGRTNFSIGGTANVSKKLSFSGNFNFVKTDFATPPVAAGLGSNSAGGPGVFINLFYTPRNMDLMGWPYQNPVTGGSVYYRNNASITNPRWLLENAAQTNDANRLFGNVATSYKLNSWAKVMYRLGMDTYNEKQTYSVNRGTAPYDDPLLSPMALGFYRTTNATNIIFDHSLILNGSRNLTDDMDLSVNIGANGRRDDYEQNGVESTNQVVFGLLEHRNFVSQNNRTLRAEPLNSRNTSIILGMFADATLGYRNYLYLNVQGRNDWASTHEKDFRTQLYPGFSLSFVPTQAFSGMESDMLNFLKLRIGYGTSANFATPYKTRPTLALNAPKSIDANGNVVTLALPRLLANPNLGPELQKELEAGIELKAFNNRVGIELSVYDRNAQDQIVQRELDPATGYGTTFINAGNISNKGVEMALSITPVKTKNFDWTLRANFTKNKSLVEDLPEGSKEFVISGFSNLGAFVVEGEPFSVIKGIAATRNANGDLLITENGDYTLDPEFSIIGDPNPDFLLSGFSDINFKGLTLGVQFDYVHGGDIFSYSAGTMVGRGVGKELEEFNPELPIILPGVLADGSPNNIPQPASGVFFGNTIIGGGPDDRGIFDATRARLREVSLTYQVPGRWLGDSFVKGATISLIGNNMWFRSFNTPKSSKVDPDRTPFGTDNGIGFDFLSGPSAKRYGVNVRFNF